MYRLENATLNDYDAAQGYAFAGVCRDGAYYGKRRQKQL